MTEGIQLTPKLYRTFIKKGCNYLRNMGTILALNSNSRLKEKLKKKGTIMLLYRTTTTITSTPPPLPHS
ncbi:hypothetical protein FQN60_011108 [Etheostoma spectabile]|uniref:Uncharacterized protein n=1 Tax=Etheostoma spectabile TaxID=54343 RepID=A0A5J5DQU6_9PERO|nr:hypothetical protein FQN60_011108 [Etheostoma spectabile]